MPSNSHSPNLISSIWSVLSKLERRKYVLSIVSRVILVPLDLAGLALLGLSASLVSGQVAQTQLRSVAAYIPLSSSANIYALFAGCALGLFVLKAVLSAWISRRAHKFAAKLETAKSTELFKAYLEGEASATALSKKDVESAIIGASHMAFGLGVTAISTLIAELSLLGIISTYLAVSNLVLFLMLFAYVGLLGLLIYSRITSRVGRVSAVVESSGIALSALTRESVAALRQISLSAQRGNLVKLFGLERKRLAGANAEIQELANLTRFIVEVAVMAAVAMLIVQRFILPTQSLTPDVIAVFLAGAFRMTGTLLPVQASFAQIKQASKHSVLYFKLHRTKVSVNSLGHADQRLNRQLPSATLVSCLNVSYKYPDRRVPTISNLTFDIQPGEFVAVMGKSGVGKSTLLDLLLGNRLPSKGSVTLDGIAPGAYKTLYPGAVALVPQEPTLFSASLYANVTLDFEENLKVENEFGFRQVLKNCELETLMADIEADNIAKLGSEGQMVSGGQAQRIALARALFQRPKLLVLDEPTSALDLDTETQLNRVLQKLKGEVTIVLVTHRKGAAVGASRTFDLVSGGTSLRERKEIQ